MIGDYLLKNRTSGTKMATVAGLSVLAGAALLCAIPQTRRACGRWINNAVDGLKGRMGNNGNESGNWKQDLANAEKLKGPVGKRRNASQINVPSAGTSAWKDEWSSE